jgi:sulfite reductase (NADPH) flavoprotein alpha-component
MAAGIRIEHILIEEVTKRLLRKRDTYLIFNCFMIISQQGQKNIPGCDRKNPVRVVIKERYPLTRAHSTKQVYHVALDLQDAPIAFKSGDSIGIFAQNDPGEVDALIRALRASGEEQIVDPRSQELISLRHFLTHKANLYRLTSGFVKCIAKQSPGLQTLLLPENKAQLNDFLSSQEMIDLLQDATPDIQECCAQMSPLLPRFYSVASSPSSVPGEVHLTVALTAYPHRNQVRYGVASRFLCHLAEEKQTPIPIYVQSTSHFTLPQDHTTPIIMVGPGTGIAPFRAFMQERLHHNATGRNWLFFGDRHAQTDYYYKEFWQELASRDFLKLSTAFSRDQEHKIYVQHLMQAHSKELFAWLEMGAHFYVCGDATRMAKDVEAMLISIIQEHSGTNLEGAKAYFKSLRTSKRYLADVY